MRELTSQQVAEYFHRCYTATDGLWFMKVEEKYGFDPALEIDDQVWKVLPKIQARVLKSMLQAAPGLDGLYECLTTRLVLEGFVFEAPRHSTGFAIVINQCPWHKQMIRSGRTHLSKKVGDRICPTEYTAWAAEFGDIRFEHQGQICEGGENCTLRFSQAPTSVTGPP